MEGEGEYRKEHSGGNYYTVVGNSSIAVVNYIKPTATNYTYSLLNLTSLILTDWIWPKFEQSIQGWSYSLPESILNSSYSIQVGKKL